jgi:hypothetical protein
MISRAPPIGRWLDGNTIPPYGPAVERYDMFDTELPGWGERIRTRKCLVSNILNTFRNCRLIPERVNFAAWGLQFDCPGVGKQPQRPQRPQRPAPSHLQRGDAEGEFYPRGRRANSARRYHLLSDSSHATSLWPPTVPE